jgi:hypothetical protein
MYFPFRSKRAPKKKRRVVYTCLFGYSERFNDFPYRSDDVDFICFTDDPTLESQFWTIRHLPYALLDPPRVSKRIKHLPHVFLSEYEESLYVDNRVGIKITDPNPIFDLIGEGGSSALRCFRHPWRNCVYAEAEEVIRLRYDEPGRVRSQMEFYRYLNYPEDNGLVSSGILLRRHGHPSVIEVGEGWYQQLLRHSMRDQLSFNVVAWYHGFKIDYFDRNLLDDNLFEWPVDNGPRLPRDFDDSTYLRLNPDLSGMTQHPRLHFLLHGVHEGRPYREDEAS